jgi:hypothetical protein
VAYFCLAIMVASACKSNAYLTTPQAAGWDFIKSAGGIRIEPARRLTASSWVLPVTCDISGVKAITATPTAMHSGLVVTENAVPPSSIGVNVSLELRKFQVV